MRSVVGVAVVLVLLTSCAASGSASITPSASTGSASTAASASAANPSPTTASHSCPNPEGGELNTCLGQIDAGTYQTSTFHPHLTYTVPAGWENLEDLPGNFLLLPPGATLGGVNPGTSDYLGVYSSVVAPGLCTGEASTTVPLTFDGLVGFLTSNPLIAVSNRKDVSIGGLQGMQMDLVTASAVDDGCPGSPGNVDIYVGAGQSSLVHGLIQNYGVRIYLLHNSQETLVIEVADAPGGGSDFPDWPTAAAEVAATFQFTP